MAKLQRSLIELIEGKNFAHLATLMRDGSPQVTPVWVDHDGEFLLVNTALGRVKQRNISRDPRIAISICDEKNPYHMASVRGRVVAQITEGADKHIDKLAKKYLGKEKYPAKAENRVIFKIKPEHVFTG